MKEFENLLKVAERLLGPDGCPWDLKQTFFTLQAYLLEETYELLEAIDEKNAQNIKEELGDVFYTLIFIAKLAEKEEMFCLKDSIESVREKLIRRHPHIFAENRASSAEEVAVLWEKIKKEEGKKSPIAGIPAALPALARAQKIIHKLKNKQDSALQENFLEHEIGQKIWNLVEEAESKGINAESSLRAVCFAYEQISLKGGR